MFDNTVPSPCPIPRGSTHCQSYAPGHQVHWIHAGRVGKTPWGWRDGVITAVSADGWLDVDYVLETGRVRGWHHEDLTGELASGDPVRVHEGYWMLGAPSGWFSLRVTSGLGAVPQPEDLGQFAGQFSAGVVDLSTGRAVAVDHIEPEDEKD
jgi:hypothetical protein